MAIVGPNSYKIILLKNNLNNHFEITNVGELKHILSLWVTCDCSTWTIYLDQLVYIQCLVSWFGIKDCHPVLTLLASNHGLLLAQASWTSEDQQAYNIYVNDINYISLIGSFLFATQTWPNIQFAVGLIA